MAANEPALSEVLVGNDEVTAESNGEQVVELLPGRDERGMRLDRFVAVALPEITRTFVQELIENGAILVDGQRRRAAFKMTPGERVTVNLPAVTQVDVEPEAIPLDIVHEDDDVLVINKPAGMVVHPAPGHPRGTVVNAVLHHAPQIAIAESNRPGIVHRLDKETSGLLVIAKSDRAHTSLVNQFQDRKIEKSYVALVVKPVEPEEGTIDAAIARDPAQRQRMSVRRDGREAVTNFRVRERRSNGTLLDVAIETGRTHQIRVHLAFIGHPVVGDEVYGGPHTVRLAKEIGMTRQFLHAERLAFALPSGERVTFTAPLPADLEAALAKWRDRSVPVDE